MGYWHTIHLALVLSQLADLKSHIVDYANALTQDVADFNIFINIIVRYTV
jgi:hypothetical protein